jgi:hypothetical protein
MTHSEHSDLINELREARAIIDYLQDKNEDLEQANVTLKFMLNKSINASNMRDIMDGAINGYKLN